MLLVLVVALALQDAPAAAERFADTRTDSPVGPADVLRVTVYGHGDLTHTVVVEADGTFVFPLLGRIKATGLTAQQLEHEVARLLAQGYIRDPQVSVVVQSYRSRTVYVIGEVSRPGSYPLPEGGTLIEILSRAGPLLGSAGGDVVILRPRLSPADGTAAPGPGGGSPTSETPAADIIRVNLDRLQSGALENNVALRPNDTVLVAKAAKVYVTGAVHNPGAYAIAARTTVRQAIGLAGGHSGRGVPRRLRIVRLVAGRTEKLKADIDDVLQPGDTVVVEKGLF